MIVEIEGIALNVNDTCLNDWNFLKMLRKIDRGDSGYIVDVGELLIGEDQMEKLEDHFMKDGIVPADAMVTAISDLLNQIKELKNS